MKSLQHHLHQLNSLSKNILEELNKKEPSMDIIRQKMDLREAVIIKFGSLTKSFQKDALSSDERRSLTQLFDDFAQLNKDVQSSLHKTLSKRQEKWIQASNQRKAEAGYNQTRKPDISYF